MKAAIYVVPWWIPAEDERPMGPPEQSLATLNTMTVGLLVPRPFGEGTDLMLEIFADRQTGAIVTTVGDVPTREALADRRWEPYMDAKQWGTPRSTRALRDGQLENDANEPDE